MINYQRTRRHTASKLLFLLALTSISGCAIFDTDQGKHEEKIATTNVKLAIGYLKQGKYDIALTKVNRALEADSDNADAHTAAAFIFERLEKQEKADEHYQRAIELKPEDGSVYNNYGVYLCRRKQWSESVKYLIKAAEFPLYPSPERAYENAGACARKIPDLVNAELYLRKALSTNPQSPLALYEMAQISYAHNKLLSVRAYLQRYEQVANHTAESLWLGIQAEQQLGDENAVARYAKQLQTKFPTSNEFKKLLDANRLEAGS